LRTISYKLGDNGASASFLANIEDRFGKTKVILSMVRGWRREIALKHLAFNSDRWDISTIKAYVGIQVLKAAKNREEALYFLKIVEALSRFELHFWASKFLSNEKTRKAWRSFYGKKTY